MEQFSHDLTLALEETSRVRAGHCWGGRRRTRSTGNLRKFQTINAHVIQHYVISFTIYHHHNKFTTCRLIY